MTTVAWIFIAAGLATVAWYIGHAKPVGTAPDPIDQPADLDLRPWPVDDDDDGICVEPPPLLIPHLPPVPPAYVEHGIERLETFLKEHTS